MKALVINGFDKSNKADQDLFQNFLRAVSEGFDRVKSTLVGDPQIEARHFTDLDDYLYEVNSEFIDPESKKRFDYLDFVFIDGNPNCLPWMKKCKKLKMLFKMWKQTNKITFASGVGFCLLIYYCATNFADITVINGKERGTDLDYISDIPEIYAKKLVRNEVFLDASTGDYYNYVQTLKHSSSGSLQLKKESAQWVPSGNVGLHHNQKASFALKGNFITKTKTYKARDMTQK